MRGGHVWRPVQHRRPTRILFQQRPLELPDCLRCGSAAGKKRKPMRTKDETKERLAIRDCEPLKIKLMGKHRSKLLDWGQRRGGLR